MWNIVDKTLLRKLTTISNGGAYSYYLSYQGCDKNGQKSGDSIPLYDSDKVGGERSNCSETILSLHEATANLEDYFFLDTLNSGESISKYTVADISMRFAVELANNSPGWLPYSYCG